MKHNTVETMVSAKQERYDEKHHQQQRLLQAFVIYDPVTKKNYTSGGGSGVVDDTDGSGTGGGEDDGNDTSTEGGVDDVVTVGTRPSTLVACSHVSKDIVSIKTIVYLQYTVELNKLNVSVSVYDDEIPTYVGSAMIDSLEQPLCASTTNNCTLSISTGPDDTFTKSCKPSSTGTSKSCYQYQGTIQITHTDDCTDTDITSGTIAALQDVIDADEQTFVASINKDRNVPKGGAIITNVDLIQSNTTSNIATIASNANAPSKYEPGTIMTAILLGVLGLIGWILIMLWFWYRKRQDEINRLKAQHKFERLSRKQRALDEDLKSIRTDWSAAGNPNDETTSYVKPDPHDLGLVHKTVDVHICRSATCPICIDRHLGRITMVSVRDNVDPLTNVAEKRLNESNKSNSKRHAIISSVISSLASTSASQSLPPPIRKQRTPRSSFCKDDADDEELTLATPAPECDDYDINTAPLEHNQRNSSNVGRATMNVIRSLSLFDRAEQQQQQQSYQTIQQSRSGATKPTGPTVNSIGVQEQLNRLPSIGENDDDHAGGSGNSSKNAAQYVRRSRWEWASPASSKSTTRNDKSMAL